MSIKETLERLDEKFLTNPRSKMSYLSGDEKRELVKFVEEEIKLATEEIVPKKPERYKWDYKEGVGELKDAEEEIINKIKLNISKYFEV